MPVDGDTYDVPMQIATVEQERKDAYRREFGDEASQKDLSPVTHVARGKGIPPVLILHVAGHPETTAQSQRLVKALQEADLRRERILRRERTTTGSTPTSGSPVTSRRWNCSGSWTVSWGRTSSDEPKSRSRFLTMGVDNREQIAAGLGSAGVQSRSLGRPAWTAVGGLHARDRRTGRGAEGGDGVRDRRVGLSPGDREEILIPAGSVHSARNIGTTTAR